MDEIGSLIINENINFRVENIIFQEGKSKWKANFFITVVKLIKSFEVYVHKLIFKINLLELKF